MLLSAFAGVLAVTVVVATFYFIRRAALSLFWFAWRALQSLWPHSRCRFAVSLSAYAVVLRAASHLMSAEAEMSVGTVGGCACWRIAMAAPFFLSRSRKHLH